MKKKILWLLSSLLLLQLLFPWMIAFAHLEGIVMNSGLAIHNWQRNEKSQIQKEADSETVKKWVFFVSIASSFQQYCEYLRPSFAEMLLNQSFKTENLWDVKTLENRKVVQKVFKEEGFNLVSHPIVNEEEFLVLEIDPESTTVVDGYILWKQGEVVQDVELEEVLWKGGFTLKSLQDNGFTKVYFLGINKNIFEEQEWNVSNSNISQCISYDEWENQWSSIKKRWFLYEELRKILIYISLNRNKVPMLEGQHFLNNT